MPNLCDGIGVIDGDELIGVKLSLVRSMKLFKDNPRYLTTYSVNAEQRLRGTEVLLYVY